jgi:YgiT-type zinc finger domain-containing protein
MLKCYECIDGTYVPIKQDWHAIVKDGYIVVPDIEVLTCKSCGAECFDPENSRKVDQARANFRVSNS